MLITDQRNSSNTTDTVVYTQSTLIQVVQMIGDFVLRLTSNDPLTNNDPLISTATLDPIKLEHNGTVLRCADHLVYEKANENAEVMIILNGRCICNILY